MKKNSQKNHTHHIVVIVGARPNFMKAAPLMRALARHSIPARLIHTGQHYDENMSAQFFSEFRVKPDTVFSLTERTEARQLTEIMQKLITEFEARPPAIVVVVGDVTSTLAGALVASKLRLPLAHVEAGLRSYNRLMPEEANRVLTDHIADLLFAVSSEDRARLRDEGVCKGVHVVGNIMIDLLAETLPSLKEKNERYYFATLHRAENVDRKEVFMALLDALEHIAHDAPLYLPLHPRTEKMARTHGLYTRLAETARLLPPLSYRDSLEYQKSAALVLTDSGGVQEESSFLGVPCLTLRTETERPLTVSRGTNIVAGVTKRSILNAYRSIHPLRHRCVRIPLWDGKTAERIVTHIETFLHR